MTESDSQQSPEAATPTMSPITPPITPLGGFPHHWRASILPTRPLILPRRHFVYPRQAEEVERGALELLIQPLPAAPLPMRPSVPPLEPPPTVASQEPPLSPSDSPHSGAPSEVQHRESLSRYPIVAVPTTASTDSQAMDALHVALSPHHEEPNASRRDQSNRSRPTNPSDLSSSSGQNDPSSPSDMSNRSDRRNPNDQNDLNNQCDPSGLSSPSLADPKAENHRSPSIPALGPLTVETASFLATCALGFADPLAPSGLWTCPNPDQLCAVAGGYAYLIDTLHPAVFEQIPYRPVLAMHAALDANLLLFIGNRSILAYGPQGCAWESPRLSDEGLTIQAITATTLHGTGWQLATDGEVTFTLDLADGTLC